MAPSRGLTTVNKHLCYQCRAFSTTAPHSSGHNRWSKIKHDKGRNDLAKHRQRSIFADEISTASRLFGPSPASNPRLADLITKSKREGFPKASIEAAIARGQGRSMAGTNLEYVMLEAILSHNIGLIVECETDSKLRTISDVRHAIKLSGGTMSPSTFLFRKRGRVTFEHKEGITSAEAMDAAVDAGADDIEDMDDGKVVVFTEPEKTRAVGDAMAQALDLQVSTSGSIWDSNPDTTIELANEEVAQYICTFVDNLHEKESNVQALAMNVSQGSVDKELWEQVQARLGI